MTDTDCLFCRIAAGDIPADVVASTDTVVAFRDIAPKAPVHVLVIPRAHHADAAAVAAADPTLLADMLALAHQVAADECDGHYRTVFNTGSKAGQTVFHAHAHVLGGGELGWSPA